MAPELPNRIYATFAPVFLTTAVGPAEPSATRDEEFETDRLACPVGANAAMEEENVPVTGSPASVDPLHGCQTLVVVFLQRMMALFVGCARAASWKSKRAASAPATPIRTRRMLSPCPLRAPLQDRQLDAPGARRHVQQAVGPDITLPHHPRARGDLIDRRVDEIGPGRRVVLGHLQAVGGRARQDADQRSACSACARADPA